MTNPYSDPESLGLEIIFFDEPELSYEFNTLCFWATKDGRIFSASDSGCSCPIPFERYEGKSQKDVVQEMEQVGSVAQAISIFDAWGKGDLGSKRKLEKWFIKHRRENMSDRITLIHCDGDHHIEIITKKEFLKNLTKGDYGENPKFIQATDLQKEGMTDLDGLDGYIVIDGDVNPPTPIKVATEWAFDKNEKRN